MLLLILLIANGYIFFPNELTPNIAMDEQEFNVLSAKSYQPVQLISWIGTTMCLWFGMIESLTHSWTSSAVEQFKLVNFNKIEKKKEKEMIVWIQDFELL